MAYGYPYQPGGMPNYFNTNYAPPAPQNMQGMHGMQQTQQPAANVTWMYANGMAGARDQIVQPGQTAWMMDNNDPDYTSYICTCQPKKIAKREKNIAKPIDKLAACDYNIATRSQNATRKEGDNNVSEFARSKSVSQADQR